MAYFIVCKNKIAFFAGISEMGLYHNGIRFTDCVLWNASLNLVHGRQAKLWVEVSSMTFYLNAARMS